MRCSVPWFPFRPSMMAVLTSALLSSSLLAVGCSKSEDSGATSAPARAAYGEELIGYKSPGDSRVPTGANNDANLPANANAGQGAPGSALPSGPDDAFFPSEPEPVIVAPPNMPPPVNSGPAPVPSVNPVVDAGSSGSAHDGGRQRDAGASGDDLTALDGGAIGSDAGIFTDAGLGPLVFRATPPSAALELENPFRLTEQMAASTFSIDVDTGSYTLARSALNQGVLPNPSTVRIEEFINYFHLHYKQPEGEVPFSVYTELGDCPWNPAHELMMVGIQGQEVPLLQQPAANLVFLLDVSGSMNDPAKLPLLKKGFRMLTRQLRSIDKVSIVTYASGDRVVIEGVPGDQKDIILNAIDQLQAGGSTNGEGGIQRAYTIAQQQFIVGGNNRVLLATDGDFNVGLSTTEELAAFIATKRDTGVFFSVYGFGSPLGNFMDANAEQLADNGNGVYFFIDGPEEARRAFIHTATGSLLTVAKDVKLQLEFNPEQVKAYRLIGYENRVLNNADFSNDAVDAGELGAGLSVTALFEIIPAGSEAAVPTAIPGTDPLEAQAPPDEALADAEFPPVVGADLVEVRIRYKGRDASTSELLQSRYGKAAIANEHPSLKFAFASAVAELAMQLRGSQYLPVVRTEALREQIARTLPAQQDGAVQEFLDLSRAAHQLYE